MTALKREPGRLITAMATPFLPDGSLDVDGARRLAQHLVSTGTTCVLVNGTTGESPTLTHSEKFRLLDAVIEAVGSQAPVMMGTGTYSTRESVELTQEATEHGADSILLVAPYYNRPPQEGLYQHFAAVAQATELPIMLYNIPGRTSVDVLPETVIRLSRIPNIFAVKEASGIVTRTAEILIEARPDFRVYAGDDVTGLPVMALGGFGIVSVLGNIAGLYLSDMIAAQTSGRPQEAARLHQALAPLMKNLFITSNPIPLKCALRLLGLPGGSPRLPLLEATPAEEEIIRATLEKVRLLI